MFGRLGRRGAARLALGAEPVLGTAPAGTVRASVVQSDETSWLEPTPVEPLIGQEQFTGVSGTVAEFWRWGFSDLRTNIVRGVLAEFLVAKAVAAREPVRIAWDNFDVVSAAGTRIEVKSSAYLQSWAQKRLSTITFTGLTGLRWDAKRVGETTARFAPTSSSSRSRSVANPRPTTRWT